MLCRLYLKFLDALQMLELQDRMCRMSFGCRVNVFHIFSVYDMRAKRLGKSDKWPEVSKINLSVTPSAKNRSLFSRDVFAFLAFFFFGKGLPCMHGKMAQFWRDLDNLLAHALDNVWRNASAQFLGWVALAASHALRNFPAEDKLPVGSAKFLNWGLVCGCSA